LNPNKLKPARKHCKQTAEGQYQKPFCTNMPLAAVHVMHRRRLSHNLQLTLVVEVTDDSESESSSSDEDDGEGVLAMLALHFLGQLSRRFDRGWWARQGGRHITSLSQLEGSAGSEIVLHRLFRFNIEQIDKLMSLVEWPADGVIRSVNGSRHVHWKLESLLELMARLSSPRSLFDLTRTFGRDEFRLSEMTSGLAWWLWYKYEHQTQNLVQ